MLAYIVNKKTIQTARFISNEDRGHFDVISVLPPLPQIVTQTQTQTQNPKCEIYFVYN